jgi:DNA-binding response OmpR family regulator
MTSAGILTIEDDAAIRRGIVDSLKATGYIVWQSGRADEGTTMALHKPCDLVLLDLVLPGGSGLDVLAEVRREKPTLPVIILTARGEEQDRVKGLRLGADDYVVKPFSLDELLARVAAVLRRSPARASTREAIQFPFGEMDWSLCQLRGRDGSVYDLSQRETSLLDYLARHAGRAIDRDELLRGVWQIDTTGVSTRTVDMHVARLREKLGGLCGDTEVIKTIRGKGYMIDAAMVRQT